MNAKYNKEIVFTTRAKQIDENKSFFLFINTKSNFLFLIFMTSIITGDIINSRKLDPKNWIEGLKIIFNSVGKYPQQWQIYRGDEFQLEVVDPKEALYTAIRIKAYLKTLKLDARMSIGFGDKSFTSDKISESNGSAFIRSGTLFETLKKRKINLAIQSSKADFDREMNLILKLGMTFMDHWLVQSAEYVAVALNHPSLSQEEIGKQLGINQSAVSRRRKRAQFDLVTELDLHFKKQVLTLFPKSSDI